MKAYSVTIEISESEIETIGWILGKPMEQVTEAGVAHVVQIEAKQALRVAYDRKQFEAAPPLRL